MAIVKPCEQRTFCCSDVFNAMQKKETGAFPNNGIGAIGDRHLKNKAYGPFQIRLPYWKDVITWKRIVIAASFPEGVLNSREVSELVVCQYMERYLAKFRPKDKFGRPTGDGPFERLTKCQGTMADVEKVARIHNGGPSGHRRDTTQKYWNGGTDTHPDFRYWLCEVTKHK